MIRVDEIYSNIFVPKIFQKTKQACHWFDPFGSTKFEDLKTVFNYDPTLDKKLLNNNYNDIFLFWDQEPFYDDLHYNTIKQHQQRFNQNSLSTMHVVTSEKDSRSIQNLQNTYGYKPHYYFFHGWACLDWFRGYNRSLLIERAINRKPTKTFMSPNRIVGGKRDHRILFLYHIYKNNLDHNHISAPSHCPFEKHSISDIATKFQLHYTDIVDIFKHADLPKRFSGENEPTMSSYQLTNFSEASDSLFYVPTETVCSSNTLHLTEKSFKAIALEMPFILIASVNSLEYLRSYGFKTFGGIIDESYDSELDNYCRVEKVVQLLKDIDGLSIREKQQIHRHCLPIVEHNYNHFYYGNFENILWNELTSMMDCFYD